MPSSGESSVILLLLHHRLVRAIPWSGARSDTLPRWFQASPWHHSFFSPTSARTGDRSATLMLLSANSVTTPFTILYVFVPSNPRLSSISLAVTASTCWAPERPATSLAQPS